MLLCEIKDYNTFPFLIRPLFPSFLHQCCLIPTKLGLLALLFRPMRHIPKDKIRIHAEAIDAVGADGQGF